VLTKTHATPADDALEGLRGPLAERLLRHARAGEIVIPPAVPDLMLMRLDKEDSVCGIYEPCVAVILQGRKRVSIGDQVLHYDPQHFFVTPLDLPASAVILEASAQAPYLSVALRLDLQLVSSMLIEGVVPPARPAGDERHAMSTGVLDAGLLDAFRRLLELVDTPAHAPALAPQVQREITYRLLTGEAGWRLRQIAAVDSQGSQVSRAIELLRSRFTEAMRIDDLARAAHMSVSSLHHHFKALTGMSPLQFQKQLRLAEARRLMLAERLDAATAAYRVGYESPSHFSREYGRRFGAPPMRDIARLRQLAE
jgi:AraC-like DNA-binding protein